MLFRSPDSITDAIKITKALQLNLIGENAAGEKIVSVFIMTFTNSCDDYPVLENGQSAGWTEFVSCRQ